MSKKLSAAEMAAAYAAQLSAQEAAAPPLAPAAPPDQTAAAMMMMQQQQQMMSPEQQAAAGWDPAMMMQYMQQYYAMAAAAAANTGAMPGSSATSGMPTWPTQPPQRASIAGGAAPRTEEGTGPVRFLWVGGLPPDATEDEVAATFSVHGRVDGVKLLPGRNCGFVRFEELSAAVAAHDRMHGTQMRMSTLKIGWAKTDPFERDDQHAAAATSRTLWVGSVHPETTQEELHAAFAEFGPVESIRVVPHKSCAFVAYTSLDSARRAKSRANGRILHGQAIRVNYGRTETTTTITPPGMGAASGTLAISGAPAAITPVKSPLVPLLHPPSAFISTNAADPAPEAAPPPVGEMLGVIDKFADYVMRNGRSFEDSARARQAATPTAKLAFLTPTDPNHAYYRWKIHELWAEKRRQLMPQQQPVAPTVPEMSAEDRIALSGFLDGLVSTKESIKIVKDWVTSRPEHVGAIAARISRACDDAADFGKRLSIVYLINDVLHFGFRKRPADNPDALDEFAVAFKAVLPAIAGTVGRRTTAADDRTKIAKVFEIWESRHILSSDFVTSLKSMLSSASSPPPPQQPSPSSYQPQYQPQPPPVPPQDWQQQYLPPPPPPPDPEPLPTYSDVAQMVGSIRDEVANTWAQQQQQQQQQQREQNGSRGKRRYFDILPSDDADAQEPKRDRRW